MKLLEASRVDLCYCYLSLVLMLIVCAQDWRCSLWRTNIEQLVFHQADIVKEVANKGRGWVAPDIPEKLGDLQSFKV